MADPDQTRPPLPGDDQEAALLEAPDDAVRGEAFNVGSDDQNYRISELAEVLAEVSGCAVELGPGAAADPRSYRVSFAKLAGALPELRFEWDAARGARELLDAYRAAGLTLEQFEGRSYVRLRQLRHLLDTGELGADLRWASAAAG